MPRALIVLLPLALTGACIYPYPDRSNPAPAPAANHQAFVAEPSGLHAHVCHLRTDRRKVGFPRQPTSSAVLVDGRYLVTAAHNVADYGGSTVQRIRVTCGAAVASQTSAHDTLERADLARARAVPAYAFRLLNRRPQFEHDYAFLDLGRQVTAKPGFHLDESIVPRIGETIHLAGYPGGGISSGDSLHAATGRVVDVQGNLMTLDIVTATGNSGGPLWVVRDGRPYLVGILVTDRTARLLNRSFFESWRAWPPRTTAGTAP